MVDLAMQPGMKIRKAVPTDIDELVAIEQRSFAIPWSRESLSSELIAGSQSHVLVALSATGKVIGYIGCWFVLDEGQINNIAVDPDWRQSGVGSALLSELLLIGRQRGIHQFTLEVRPSNRAARHLYGKFGFVESGMRRAYYPDNHEDAIIMLKNED